MAKNFLTPDEMAELLGLKVGTIYKWCQSRRVDHLRIGGGRIRFTERQVESIVKAAEVKATPRMPKFRRVV